MRDLIVTQNVTVDGAVEMLDDWFDPQAQDEDLLAESHRQDAASDALLLGRRTFEDFRGYWPARSDDATGISAYLDGVAKYVVSSTLSDPRWQNTTVVSTDPLVYVDALKRTEGKDIVLTGSIALAHTLLGAALVDEVRLFVHPVVQARGRRLFPAGVTPPNLTLAAPATSFSSGVALLRYRLR